MKLLFVLSLLFLAYVSYAPLSVESYLVIPSVLRPGQQGVIQLTLKNVQPSGSATVIAAVEEVAVYPASSAEVRVKSSDGIFVGTIEGGSSAIVTIPIEVLATAKGGISSPSFHIAQKDAGKRQSISIPVKIDNPAILTLSLSKQSLEVSDWINITIKNDGGRASRLTIRVNDSSTIVFAGQDQVFAGDINGNIKVIEAAIDARNAQEGINSLPLRLSYVDELGELRNETKMLSIAVKKDKADLAITQLSGLVTSKDGILKLRVKNTGRELQNLRLVIRDELLKAAESTEIKLGDMAQGEEKEIEARVFVDAEPGSRQSPITLKWVEGGVEKSEDTKMPLAIASDADVAVFLDARPAPISPGMEHTLSVLVSNIGSHRIENVEAGLEGGKAFEILNAQPTQYIGGLEKDDFSTVQFKVKAKGITPGNHQISILVRYRDQSGIWVLKNVTSTIVVRAAEAKGDGGMLPLAIIVAIAGGIYWWYKKKGKKNQ